jgi:hypothetical protein
MHVCSARTCFRLAFRPYLHVRIGLLLNSLCCVGAASREHASVALNECVGKSPKHVLLKCARLALRVLLHRRFWRGCLRSSLSTSGKAVVFSDLHGVMHVGTLCVFENCTAQTSWLALHSLFHKCRVGIGGHYLFGRGLYEF